MMTNDRFIEIERRLAVAEREVEKTRAQVRALQERERPPSRLRRDGVLGLLGLMLMFAVTRGPITEAQGKGPQVLTVKAPFRVMDASGTKVILNMDEFGAKGTSLTIGDAKSAGVSIGIGPTGSGSVNVRTAAGKHGVAIRDYNNANMGVGMGVYVFAPDGETIEGSLALGPTKKGRLVLGDAKSGAVDAGVDVFGANGKEMVRLTADQKGGLMQVFNPAGVAVGGLLANASGGGLALTGPAGGPSAISLKVEKTGGTVRVFPQAGGSAQAELTAEPTGGAFTAYSASGKALAFFGSKEGKGQLELNDAAGVKMVAAGSLANHKGVVYASPWRPSSDVHGDPSVLKGGRNVGEK